MTLTFDDVAAALESSSFQFARTMPHVPHWYTLRKNWNQPVEFEAVVQFIRDHGTQMRWGKYNHFYLQVNEWKYWTMGSALEKTILINRDAHGFKSPFDALAEDYDRLRDQADEARLFSMIDGLEGSVLDVGAGTGRLLEYAWPRQYLGIEPSYKMVDILRRKFPRAATVAAPLERFYTAQRFVTAVALYGSANYISPAALRRLPSFLVPGGSYFVMICKPDERTGDGPDTGIYDHQADVLPGTVSEFGPYLIIQGTV